MKHNDTKHMIIDNVQLKKDAKLHRFTNGGNDECSAIYLPNGIEAAWHYRDREADMIDWWNNGGGCDGWEV